MNHARDTAVVAGRTFRLIFLVVVSTMLAIPLHSASRVAGPQGAEGGIGLQCANASTGAEKLICSERDLVSLDLEYSSVLEAKLQNTEGIERNDIRNGAMNRLQVRDRCVDDSTASTALRSMQLQCVQNWYYERIAELSDLPKTPPAEWTPRLIAGVSVYSRNQGLSGSPGKKPSRDVYARASSTGSFFKMSFEEGEPQPARHTARKIVDSEACKACLQFLCWIFR